MCVYGVGVYDRVYGICARMTHVYDTCMYGMTARMSSACISCRYMQSSSYQTEGKPTVFAAIEFNTIPAGSGPVDPPCPLFAYKKALNHMDTLHM